MLPSKEAFENYITPQKPLLPCLFVCCLPLLLQRGGATVVMYCLATHAWRRGKAWPARVWQVVEEGGQRVVAMLLSVICSVMVLL
jgi:hypothetical protein